MHTASLLPTLGGAVGSTVVHACNERVEYLSAHSKKIKLCIDIDSKGTLNTCKAPLQGVMS